MTKIIFFSCSLIVFAVAVLFCAQSVGSAFPSVTVDEAQDENYKRGKAFVMEKKDREAMEAFYKVVNSRSEAPESHLELGVLAMRLDMPLDAIYHYRQYLRQSQTSNNDKLVEDQIRGATKKFLSQQPGGFDSGGTGPDIEGKYDAMRKENDALKREIQLLRSRIAELEVRLGNRERTEPRSGEQVNPRSGSGHADTAENTSVGTRTIPARHTIVRGDTLERISRKYYGTPQRWRDIYNYNRKKLSTPNALKPGDTLDLPPP